MINNYALHQAVSKMGYSILMIEKPTAILKKNYSRINPRYITRSFYNWIIFYKYFIIFIFWVF